MYSEDEMRLLGFMDIARRNGTMENEERAEKMSRTFGQENTWNGNKVGRKRTNRTENNTQRAVQRVRMGGRSVQNEEDVREYGKEEGRTKRKKKAAQTKGPQKI